MIQLKLNSSVSRLLSPSYSPLPCNLFPFNLHTASEQDSYQYCFSGLNVEFCKVRARRAYF